MAKDNTKGIPGRESRTSPITVPQVHMVDLL